MSDENKQPAKKKPQRLDPLVLAAIVTAVGGVVAAAVGLLNASTRNTINGNGNAQGNSGTTVVGNSGTTIVGSHDITIGRKESAFDAADGVAIEVVGGEYTAGNMSPTWNPNAKPTGRMYAHISNRSHRKINNLQLQAFPGDTVVTQPAILDLHADSLFPKQIASKMIRWSGAIVPPNRVRFCLTFESETPGEFITLLVSASRSDPIDNPTADQTYRFVSFRYQLETPDVVFKSQQSGNCTQQGETEKVDMSDSHIYR